MNEPSDLDPIASHDDADSALMDTIVNAVVLSRAASMETDILMGVRALFKNIGHGAGPPDQVITFLVGYADKLVNLIGKDVSRLYPEGAKKIRQNSEDSMTVVVLGLYTSTVTRSYLRSQSLDEVLHDSRGVHFCASEAINLYRQAGLKVSEHLEAISAVAGLLSDTVYNPQNHDLITTSDEVFRVTNPICNMNADAWDDLRKATLCRLVDECIAEGRGYLTPDESDSAPPSETVGCS